MHRSGSPTASFVQKKPCVRCTSWPNDSWTTVSMTDDSSVLPSSATPSLPGDPPQLPVWLQLCVTTTRNGNQHRTLLPSICSVFFYLKTTLSGGFYFLVYASYSRMITCDSICFTESITTATIMRIDVPPITRFAFPVNC